MLLEASGFVVSTATSGRGAIERAKQDLPRAILLDIGLPDLDGYAVLAQLRQLDGVGDGTFIALTGRSSPDDLRRMEQSGFHHTLVKPPDLQRLIRLLRSVFEPS
jgi:CheY-like chemotaxis protein